MPRKANNMRTSRRIANRIIVLDPIQDIFDALPDVVIQGRIVDSLKVWLKVEERLLS